MAENIQTATAGNAARAAMETLDEHLGAPPSLQFNYAFATLNNLLVGLEQADGVPGGSYGSTGALLPEYNPVTGAEAGT